MTKESTKKKWTVAEVVPETIKKKFKEFSELEQQLLFNRGLTKLSNSEIKKFLSPEFETGLHDPFKMADMEKAVERILTAIKKKEKIAVWGDYDVDGITATAIVLELFKHLNYEIEYYIPHREGEGYGLNEEGIKELEKKGVSLIITVDCGIRSFEVIKKAKADIIVTDHHELEVFSESQEQIKVEDKIIPEAYAVVNPKRPDCKYPFKELSGAGVAYKLAAAILGKNAKTRHDLLENSVFLKWLLDLVAIGTIGDIVPLIDENRVIAKFGLVVLGKTKRVGLQKLYKISGIKLESLDAYKVAFQIIPRLNASGRLETAKSSLEILITKNEQEAEIIAENLNELNQERQAITEKILNEAKGKLAKDQKVIIVSGKGWNAGVVGIVASRLVDEFGRPALVLVKNGDTLKGSGRSIKAFNLVRALEICAPYLEKFGGHKGAAGLTLRTENLENFEKQIYDHANTNLHENDLIGEIEIDKELNAHEINSQNYEIIKKFEPFGYANPTPTFLTKNLKISALKILGSNFNHIKLTLTNGKNYIDAIGFNKVNGNGHLQIGDCVDVVYNLLENNWMGRQNIELKIVDLRSTR